MKSVRLLLLVSVALTAGAGAALSAIIPQSPVDFNDAGIAAGAAPKLDFTGYPNQVAIGIKTTRSGMGKTESIKVTPTGVVPKLALNGHEYKLKEFHFHIHSEHTSNGLIYPMEMHMVHEYAGPLPTNQPLNLALGRWILDDGPTEIVGNKYPLKPIFDNLPPVPPLGVEFPNPQVNIANFLIRELLPLPVNGAALYTYMGSLTTGLIEKNAQTISETPVSWINFKEPLHMTRTQIDKYRAHFQNGNWRETQLIVGGHNLKKGTAVPEPSMVWAFVAIGGLLGGRRLRP